MKIEEYLDRLEEIEKSATSGPWEWSEGNNGSLFGDVDNPKHNGDYPYLGEICNKNDGLFIALSRPSIPVLIKIVRRYREDLEDFAKASAVGCNHYSAKEALNLTLEDL